MVCAICRGSHGPDESCPTLVPIQGSGLSALRGEPTVAERPAKRLAPPVPTEQLPAPTVQAASGDARTRPYLGPPPDSDDPMLGSTVGGFKVVRQLGVGGMGTVYLGEHALIGSKVAIKVLHPQLATSPELVQRFFEEARAVNVIGHENIINIIDLNVLPPNRYYYVMEYLDGQTLQELAGDEAMDPGEAVPILAQVCDALSAAHSHGIVHRDLKPENVVVLKRGRVEHFVKVLDFGIAKLLDAPRPTPQRTASGLIIGTPEFMAPEQASAEPVDARADIYALGVLSYLILSGRLPFEHKGIAQLLIAHRTEVPKSPREVNPSVPEALSAAIMKAIAKKPEDRFQTAAAFREALEAGLGHLEHPSPTPVTIAPTPLPSDSRHVAPFFARLVLTEGAEPVRLRCHDLSRGGVFLCMEGRLPRVFSRLKVVLEAPGGELTLTAEVVRHVSPAQAQAWRMPAGFGVQFMELSAEAREQLARLVKGLPLVEAAKADAEAGEKDDPEAEKTLDFFRKRIQGDHYVVLAMNFDAEIPDIKQRARESRRELERLRERPLSARQRKQVEQAIERVDAAVAALGQVKLRAEYDGNRGNYQGVGKCLAAGLSPGELERLRRKWLQQNQRGESSARIHFMTGSAWEAQKMSERALEEYERALALDPLNFEYHSRYWSVRRKAEKKA